jgi:hypothetical protein
MYFTGRSLYILIAQATAVTENATLLVSATDS